MEQTVIHNFNFSKEEIFIPVVAAMIQNSLLIAELLSVKRGEESFDRDFELMSLSSDWLALNDRLTEAMKPSGAQRTPSDQPPAR